jgi:hypothetical protein
MASMRSSRNLVAVVFAGLWLGGAAATGRAEAPGIGLEATTSFWFTAHEEVENGLLQAGSLDPADDVASGFNFRQGRLAVRFTSDDGAIEGLLRVRFEERTDIIDFWGLYHPAPGLSVAIGQMKIPSTGEVLVPDHQLDFITRSALGRTICDWALSRTPYISPVMAVKSYDRDLGLSLRAEWPPHDPRASAFLMVSNGLGAGRYVGGTESQEFAYTNSPGQYFYGARAEVRPLAEGLVLGAHGSLNRHDDMALDPRGPVVDLDRRVWSADVVATLPWRQRAYGFYAAGEIDDTWGNARYQYDYSGWALSTFWQPGAAPLEVGLRYDEQTSGYRQVADEVVDRHWTFGVNWRPRPVLRLQANYVAKETVNPSSPDLDDDIFILNVQFTFDTASSPPLAQR